MMPQITAAEHKLANKEKVELTAWLEHKETRAYPCNDASTLELIDELLTR